MSISAAPVSPVEGGAIRNVNLAAAARLLRVFLERRLETAAGNRRREGRRRSWRRQMLRVDPWCSDQFERRVVPRPSDSIVPSNSTVPG
jgi:hypothetical protein